MLKCLTHFMSVQTLGDNMLSSSVRNCWQRNKEKPPIITKTKHLESNTGNILYCISELLKACPQNSSHTKHLFPNQDESGCYYCGHPLLIHSILVEIIMVFLWCSVTRYRPGIKIQPSYKLMLNYNPFMTRIYLLSFSLNPRYWFSQKAPAQTDLAWSHLNKVRNFVASLLENNVWNTSLIALVWLSAGTYPQQHCGDVFCR